MERVKMRLVVQHTITLLGILVILGCGGGRASLSQDSPGRPDDDYIVFGRSVFCPTVDSHCLEEQFNGCLGQTRKQHIRENGRPAKLTLLTSGGAIAEWPLRGSKDTVTFMYDKHGIARDWVYDGTRIQGASKAVRRTPPSRR
jgi:hypothetical protein